MRILFLFLFFILSAPFYLYSWPRLSGGATIVTQNSGDRAGGLSVTVSTVSATLIYTGVPYHREVLIQNTSTNYYVVCGTFSTVMDTAGMPRWLLPPKPTGFTTNGTYSIYCVAESSAGANTIELLGSYEYDNKDYIR